MSPSEPRLTAADFDPELLRLFDRYVHGILDRRGFLVEASKFTNGVITAEGILQALNPRFAAAEQVPPGDPSIETSYLEVESADGNGRIRGYLVHPAKPQGKLPAVLVVHENRGLNPHIEDVARRIALENFLVFAPDALTSLGGYPGDEDRARELFQTLDRGKTFEDFVASAKFLLTHPRSTGRAGVVGFCYGGGVSHQLSIRVPELGAAIPFYGISPQPEQAASVRVPLLVHHAEHDERINAAWPAYESALRAAKIGFEEHTYPGTQHGFHNDTTPRYDELAAQSAWKRTIDFFDATLRGDSAASARG